MLPSIEGMKYKNSKIVIEKHMYYFVSYYFTSDECMNFQLPAS